MTRQWPLRLRVKAAIFDIKQAIKSAALIMLATFFAAFVAIAITQSQIHLKLLGYFQGVRSAATDLFFPCLLILLLGCILFQLNEIRKNLVDLKNEFKNDPPD